MSRLIRVFPDLESLEAAAVEETLARLSEAIAARGIATIALAGGSTPRGLYETLATQHAKDLDWDSVHFFFGDERYVATDREDRNENLARKALFDRIPIPVDNVHAMPAAEDGVDASRGSAIHEEHMRGFFATDSLSRDGFPRFDLVLLGLGEDGHTASLFPGDPALDEKARWVVDVPRSPTPPQVPRVTLSLPTLNAARAIVFLVAGASKRPALTEVLADAPPGASTLPAAQIAPPAGTVTWLIDRHAAPR